MIVISKKNVNIFFKKKTSYVYCVLKKKETYIYSRDEWITSSSSQAMQQNVTGRYDDDDDVQHSATDVHVHSTIGMQPRISASCNRQCAEQLTTTITTASQLASTRACAHIYAYRIYRCSHCMGVLVFSSMIRGQKGKKRKKRERKKIKGEQTHDGWLHHRH